MRSDPDIPLAISAERTMQKIGVGRTTLWQLSKPGGPLHPIRIGQRVLWSVKELETFVDAQVERQRAGCSGPDTA